jgi:hypothetical protein
VRKTLLGVVIVVAVVGAVLFTRPSGPPFVARPWTTYRIIYRQMINSNGSPNVRYENLAVHRPYEGSDLLSPSPDGAPPVTGAVSTETALYDIRDDGSILFVGGREPGPPSGDQDLATQLPDLFARHLASDLHKKERIAGLTCHDVRMFDPPSGALHKLGGTSEHDDLCITSGGLILSEQWTLDGHLVLERHALSVERSAPPLPSVAGATSPSGTTTTPTARAVHDPTSFLDQPPTPSGYRPRPAVELLVPPVNAPAGTPGMASVVWAFADGARTISVEAGGPAPQPPWQSNDTVTTRVHLTDLGDATTALRSDGAEIRVALMRGRWVRIRGTVPLRTLVRYARTVRLR